MTSVEAFVAQYPFSQHPQLFDHKYSILGLCQLVEYRAFPMYMAMDLAMQLRMPYYYLVAAVKADDPNIDVNHTQSESEIKACHTLTAHEPFVSVFSGYSVLGYAMYKINLQKATAEITTLAVDKLYRRQGIGTQLMNFMIREITDQHTIAKAITLHVDVHATEAYRLYLRLGFQKLHTIIGYYRRGSDADVLQYKIIRS
ncbi:hypothetical protein K7432_014197 [Basidiobolus ranarum]|uniref:N-acetyltransferase domain-containing protein n=1 Tax=Basidiobolus ranarum TaxID=34480 RepID=A0ABR2WI21_9FUNG